jgi:hypothetical protein
VDPHHIDADPDLTGHPDADPGSTYHPHEDPDLVPSFLAQTLEKVLKYRLIFNTFYLMRIHNIDFKDPRLHVLTF